MDRRRALACWIATVVVVSLTAGSAPGGRAYHVSPRGDDANDGTPVEMLRTISAAAARARPGDRIIVHEGIYRERISPPRGGTSDSERIVYEAAPGEKVVIKGSEIIAGWERVAADTWKAVIPNSFFGDFNPYRDRIHGDWFNPMGRVHHTGAVYVGGHWLTEAATLEEVLEPQGDRPLWFTDDAGGGDYLLNVAWWHPDGGKPVAAESFAAQRGIQTAACSEGGRCIGWIEDGDWVRYENVDLGEASASVELRAASATAGGRIEVRLDGPDGDLLGACTVPNTGDWQRWASFTAKIASTGGVRTICLVFRAGVSDEHDTTIWAQFKGIDPNRAGVEINVRQAVFYPDEPGRNYITVRGFTLEQAATPWAPPTAEQIGLIGTHWSKGWVIEDNTIRYSTCVGVTLGKHGDAYDNTSANTAEGYVKTIERGLARGWSRENIGHHLVRNNRISHCEQGGIVGSLGGAFCTITGNEIHDIHVRRLFSGAEMAGIKLHAAIDTLISGNHIYRSTRGIWLDWMAQGTRVTGNLLHDNGPSEDLFVEVNHGPFLVDSNIFLSPSTLLVNSQGGAYVHNLMAGSVAVIHGERRETPYQVPHGTAVAALHGNPSGDDRYLNNLMVERVDLTAYDPAKLPVTMSGNVFVHGAVPSKHESEPMVAPDFDPVIDLETGTDGIFLEITLDRAWARQRRRALVTTERLGRAKITNLPYEQPDGTPYRIDTDILGTERDVDNPFPGPFERPAGGRIRIRVWPR